MFFPIDDDVVHYWTFDETSGNVNADEIPGGTDMVLLDALVPPIRQATFGHGRLIVGWNSASMYAPLTQDEVDYFRDSSNPYTIEIVASSNDPGFASSLFGIDNRRIGGAGSHLYLQWLMQNNGNKNYLVQGNAAPIGGFGSGNNAFPVDDPNCTLVHTLVREVSGGDHRGLIYLNGVLVHTTGWVANYVAADDGDLTYPYRYFIGRGIGGQWGYGGVIDEVCISFAAREAEDIALRSRGGGGISTPPLTITDATLSLFGANEAKIRLTFSGTFQREGNALIPSKYELTTTTGYPATVTSLDVPAGPGFFLDVYTTATTDGASYTLKLPSGIYGGFPEERIGFAGPFQFNVIGDATGPVVTEAISIDARTLDVIFNEAVQQADAENIANYSVNNGLVVTKATCISATHYRLTTSQQVPGQSYQVTVSNVRDLTGSPT